MNLLSSNLAATTADGATLTSDLTADVGYPLANMQNGLRTKIWQVTNASAAQHYILFDLGSAQMVNAIALINSNFLANATLAIQGNATNVWTSPSVNVTIGNAGLSIDGLSLYAYFAGGSYRYWRLVWTLGGIQTVSIGRAFFGAALTLAAAHKVGFSDFFTPVVAQATTIGGQVYTDQRNKFRTLKLQFTGVTDANKYAQMVAFANAVGVNNNFVVTLDPSTTTTTGQTSIYGRLSAFPQFTNKLNVANSGQYHDATMDLVESV